MSLLLRSGRRYFAKHAWQLLLAVLGIGLGVAVVVAIEIVSGSANRSFERATSTVLGRATHRIVGGSRGIADADYVALRLAGGRAALAPVVSGNGLVDGRAFTVLGVDLFAERGMREHLSFTGEARGIDLGAFLATPGAVLLSAGAAGDLGLAVEETFELKISGRGHAAVVSGVLTSRDESLRAGLDGLIVTDIATAQELFGRPGWIDRIDVDLRGAAQEALAARLPEGLRLESTAESRGALREITRAFRTNLQALGYLALLVGAFLIYNTMAFAVVQRRAHFGILRTVGATRGQILRAVLTEAVVLGALGVALGIGLGVGLARVLLGFVAQTINDLYASLRVTAIDVDVGALAGTAGLALLACVLAAVVPAVEAVRATPRDVLRRTSLEGRVRRGVRGLGLAGLLLGGAGALVLWRSERDLTWSWIGLLGVTVASAMLTPFVTARFLAWMQPVMRRLFGAPGSLAARGAAAALSRTAVAVTALMLSVAATVGLAAMIQSFRATVGNWLADTLRADVYVSVAGSGGDPRSKTLDVALVQAFREVDGVRGAATYRWSERASSLGTIRVVALEHEPEILGGFAVIDGDGESARQALAAGSGVWISEPFGWRHDLQRGATFELETDRGRRGVRVVGVFRDYASERGHVMFSRRHYDTWFDDPAATSMALLAEDGVDVDGLVGRLHGSAAGVQDLEIRSNATLQTTSLAIFDRTFAITDVLRVLCVIVAFFGVWSALTALLLERLKEVGVLRALGATPRQVRRLLVTQSGLLGLCAGLFAMPVGALLAWLMVDVINKRSFGWTILDLAVSPGILAQALGLAVVAAVCAALHPAWAMGRAQPARALREE